MGKGLVLVYAVARLDPYSSKDSRLQTAVDSSQRILPASQGIQLCRNKIPYKKITMCLLIFDSMYKNNNVFFHFLSFFGSMYKNNKMSRFVSFFIPCSKIAMYFSVFSFFKFHLNKKKQYVFHF